MSPLYYIIILSSLLLALPGFATGSEGNNSVSNQSYPDNTSEILSAPDVLSILSDPEQYLGKTIGFNGVVSIPLPGQHQFTVADRVGCSICAAKRARNSITVSYMGKIPKSRETVQVSGILMNDTKKRYIVNATSVVI